MCIRDRFEKSLRWTSSGHTEAVLKEVQRMLTRRAIEMGYVPRFSEEKALLWGSRTLAVDNAYEVPLNGETTLDELHFTPGEILILLDSIAIATGNQLSSTCVEKIISGRFDDAVKLSELPNLLNK
eukprot:TRINITY_DN4996_c0_g1_i2.p1 TRINITY_DN4996_c0_g1~~TRINITY_DN4996_c0_g1_i2.p1  ORF type:complete len:126 (+),score=21.62 TRINITY_DN4996_c0_g1_i2:65-442(+)